MGVSLFCQPLANASDMASWIRWNSNGKPVSDGVIGTRGIVQCLSKNDTCLTERSGRSSVISGTLFWS